MSTVPDQAGQLHQRADTRVVGFRLVKAKNAIRSVRKEDELKQMQADLSQQIITLSYGSSVSCLSRLAAAIFMAMF